MIKTPFFFFTALLVFTAASAQGPEKSAAKSGKISIAVSEMEGRGLEPGEALTLTDALSTHLINTGVFRVMERGKMDVILKEQGFQQSGACTDQACIIEMGQLLGVDNMVTGSIGRVGKTYSVNIRMISVSTSEIVRTVNRNYKGEIDGLLTEVIPAAAVEFAGAQPAPPAAPVAQAAPPAATRTQAAAPAPAEPAKPQKSEEVKSSSGGGHTALWVLGGLVVVGGAVAVVAVITKKDNTSTTPGGGGQTGTVEFVW
jgi:TolB-like protein